MPERGCGQSGDGEIGGEIGGSDALGGDSDAFSCDIDGGSGTGDGGGGERDGGAWDCERRVGGLLGYG